MFEVEAGADEKQQIKFVWPYLAPRLKNELKTETELILILAMLPKHAFDERDELL